MFDDDTPLIPTGPVLASILKESWVYAAPSFKSQKIGYLRAGAVVSRSEKPAGYGSCEKGWYKIQPRGFVCNGMSATLDVANPVTEIARKRPDRSQGLPYLYGMSKFPTPPFYLKLPTHNEQLSVEPDLAGHTGKAAKTREIASVRDQLDDIPQALLNGRVVPSVTPNHHGPGALYNGRAVPRSGFAMISRFEHDGRIWGLTTDLQIVPLDRMRIITPSSFHGIPLGDAGLPVAFDRAHGDRYHKLDEKTGGLAAAGAITYREGIQLTGENKRIDGGLYWEARDGRWVRDSQRLVRIDMPKEWPQFANEGKKWIDISILKQTLVAYEGTRPVYATLVSTGADGLGDPKETHSTVRGMFLIHTKHVTVTMDSDDTEDQFDLRDVPYVQYFHEGYALHAAYWHDEFGTPRSHGCVNLHPTDAAWLFGWTTPDVPAEWHGALSLKQGTVVFIHP
ncbi:MAG: L,D-transpeptidase [Polyangiaceae bacterium]